MYRCATLRASGGRFVVQSDELSFPPEFDYGDNIDFLKVFVLAYLKLLDDSPLRTSHGEKPLKIYSDFLKLLVTSDLRQTIRMYSDLSHTLLSSSYVTGGETSTSLFLDDFKSTPIFKEYLGWYRNRDPKLLKFILSFLLFGKKLEYEDDQLNTNALRAWYGVEDRLRNLVLDPEDLHSLKIIISAILPPIDDSLLLPKFGSGRVAEKGVSGPYQKFRCLGMDKKLSYVFARSNQFSYENGFGPRRQSQLSSDSISRLKFVRKDIFKSRSICMEPNAYMYYQQEVLRWMVRAMETGPISRFVNLKDQSNSQLAAVHGSQYLSTDTIDLSSASDSVHVDLVKGCFPPKYLYYLLGTRTSQVEVPDSDQPVSVRKFAPMGSAVCFPVQCIIFTAVCIYAAMTDELGGSLSSNLSRSFVLDFIGKKFHRRRTSDTPFTRRFEPPVIYGDDIAVDTRHTVTVVSILTRLGFEVNVSKSFTHSQSFRESCGVFAFEGEEVSPVQFRLPFFKRGNWDAKVYASFIGSINWANVNGFQSLATFYLSMIREYGFKNRIPFTDDRDAFGIYTPYKRKVPEASRIWNSDYQSFFEVVQGITNRGMESQPDGFDSYSYEQWWRSRICDISTSTFSRGLHIRPQETRLAPVTVRCE